MYLYSVAIGESGVDSPKAAVAKIHKVFFLLKVDLAIKEVMPLVLNVVMSQDFFSVCLRVIYINLPLSGNDSISKLNQEGSLKNQD